MADLLITGVTLPTGTRTDLGIHDEHLADPADLSRPQVIDAAGLVALPGLVDLHTHLRQPSPAPAETIASGTAAAARGGYTAVFAMANTDPVTDTPDRVRHLLSLAGDAAAEVIPVGAITRGLGGTELTDLAALHAAGVTYFSDDGRWVTDAGLLRQALQTVGDFDGVIAQHSQDPALAGPAAWLPGTTDDQAAAWPWAAEAAAVARDVQLARDTGAHLHICHVSTAETVDVLRWAKQHQIQVTAEVTPHHLLLGSDRLASHDTTFKVNPPLRGDEDRTALRQALADGTIDAVATDHAPHLPSDKDKPFPDAKPGMIGLEYALAVVIETMVAPGLLDWSGVARRMSSAPARIGQIGSHQGRSLRPGEPATLTLVDPARRLVVNRNASLSQGRNNPYHGLDLPDPVLATIWGGRWTYCSGVLAELS